MKNPEYQKQYRLKNKDKLSVQHKEYYQKNKPELKSRAKIDRKSVV